jgi:hypothetical protein
LNRKDRIEGVWDCGSLKAKHSKAKVIGFEY